MSVSLTDLSALPVTGKGQVISSALISQRSALLDFASVLFQHTFQKSLLPGVLKERNNPQSEYSSVEDKAKGHVCNQKKYLGLPPCETEASLNVNVVFSLPLFTGNLKHVV